MLSIDIIVIFLKLFIESEGDILVIIEWLYKCGFVFVIKSKWCDRMVFIIKLWKVFVFKCRFFFLVFVWEVMIIIDKKKVWKKLVLGKWYILVCNLIFFDWMLSLRMFLCDVI